MGELLLLLRLEGPLQSWGTRSRWDCRDTGPEPTKSGIVGLLGCALGLRRRSVELEMLDAALRFAVRVDVPGIIATDYQTVTGYHRTAAGEYKIAGGTVKSHARALQNPESTIVSPRDYLHDARFLVVLSSDDGALLHQIAGEKGHPRWPGDLRSPTWPIYLGRKSCVPTRPVFAELTTEFQSLEDAIKNAPMTLLPGRARLPARLDAWIEDPKGESERQDAMRLNQARFYGFRRCRFVQVDTLPLLGSTP